MSGTAKKRDRGVKMHALSRFICSSVLVGLNDNKQVSSPPWAVSEAKLESIGKIKKFKIVKLLYSISYDV
jgi:hypothetical protein